MTKHMNETSHTSSYDDHPSSNEIRADIDQTRASVGHKIDELQARLDPNRLKEQAQETVQEMLSDTANSMTDYVREHKDEMIASVSDAARRNPLPTALIGLGLGWLLLESMGGNKSRRNEWEYERRNLRSRPRNRYDDQPGIEEGYYSLYDEEVYARSGFVGNSEFASPTADNYAAGYGSSYGSNYGSGQQSDSKSKNGHGQNPLAKAADAVKDGVADVSHEVKERVGDVKEAVEETVDGVRRQVERQVGQAGERTQQAMQQRGQQMHEWQQQAGHEMHEWHNRAQYEAQRRGRQVVRNLEDNPLTYGALALAAGAALAMLLPQTRTENRAFGETRDQLVERGQEMVETAKSHAQEVVDEVRPELEEKARQIISDVKETGTETIKATVKETAKDVADELRPVVDKAVAKGKEEARSAAQEAGIDPDKISDKLKSNKPVLNRDTLQGQWMQVKGEVKRKWGKLTDDELTTIEGNYDKLVGKIQTRYGYTRQRAEQEVNDFFESQKSQPSPQ